MDAYVGGLDGWQQAAAKKLVAIVQKAAPKATAQIKWSQPVFEQGGPFCFFKAFTRHMNFGFWRGASLKDPKGLIRSGGDRMGHVRLESEADIDAPALVALIRQAVKLNEKLGNPARTR